MHSGECFQILAFELKYTEQVDITPYRYVKPIGITIILVVVLTYIVFS